MSKLMHKDEGDLLNDLCCQITRLDNACDTANIEFSARMFADEYRVSVKAEKGDIVFCETGEFESILECFVGAVNLMILCEKTICVDGAP